MKLIKYFLIVSFISPFLITAQNKEITLEEIRDGSFRTERMVEALIQADKQFEWMIYPDDNHGIYGGNTRLHLYKKMSNFIDRTLGDKLPKTEKKEVEKSQIKG